MDTNKTLWGSFGFGFLLVFFLSSCAQGPLVHEFPDGADPVAELARLGGDFVSAYGSQLNVLAPRSFASAERAWNRAKENQERKESPRAVLHWIAESRAYLDQARALGLATRAQMEDAAVARSRALSAGAAAQFSQEFGAVDERLVGATRKAEGEDLNEVMRSRASWVAQYSDLELKALQRDATGAARERMEQARREGAETLASRTLADTEREIKAAEAFVADHRDDKAAIGIRSAEAAQAAERLLAITRVAKANEYAGSEEVAARLERERRRAEQSQSRLEEAKDELAIERGHAEALDGERRRLETRRRLDRLFEEARAAFGANEAEVYRQGDRLLIRLKGLEFPRAQAVLRERDFPLLSKVGQAIRKIGKVSILVEGHTDSEGSAATNDKLSLDRAQAVAEYLASSGAAERADIRSEGYGDRRPIASDKTAAGRAQNRRVDVVIVPEGLERVQE